MLLEALCGVQYRCVTANIITYIYIYIYIYIFIYIYIYICIYICVYELLHDFMPYITTSKSISIMLLTTKRLDNVNFLVYYCIVHTSRIYRLLPGYNEYTITIHYTSLAMAS